MGTSSSMFDFRNAKVTDAEEVKTLCDYIEYRVFVDFDAKTILGVHNY